MSLSEIEILSEPTPGLEIPEAPDTVEAAKAVRKPLSRGALIWLRLRRAPRFWIGAGIIVFMVLWAFLGPLVWQYSITDQDVYNMDMGPSNLHWFGTNALGQDIFAQTMSGLQKSLIIGFIAGPLCTIFAAVVGSVAGYIGGATDKVIAWFIDLLLVLPSFFILVLCYPIFKNFSWIAMTFFLAAFGWMIMGQVVRNQTRSLRDREFVKASRYMGFGTWSVVLRHIIPNVASLLIIDATLNVGAMIIAETTLSYFGFGVQPPNVSIGTLLAAGTDAATTRPWLFCFPAGVLIVLLLCISFVGDALRDAIDPTSGVNRA